MQFLNSAWLLICTMTFYLFSIHSHAQNSTLNTNCRKDEFACGECETQLQTDFNKLLSKYTGSDMSGDRWSSQKGITPILEDKNINDFIKESIDLMKANNPNGQNQTNMIVIGNSESLHQTTPGHPRIALKSPDGEFWLTFNTDPKATGYNSVEVMRWDGKTGSYKFQEITFGQPGHVDTSGQKCARCHRDPPRPNWDTYRAWSNVLPPRDDLIEKDEENKIDIAGRSYLSFMKKISAEKKNKNSSNSRLALLDIPAPGNTDDEKIRNIEKQVETQGFYRVPHYPEKDELMNYSSKTAPKAGSSHLAFDQLTGQNICKITNDLKNSPNFEKFKYALTAIFYCNAADRKSVDWSELKDYIPNSYQKSAVKYFSQSDSLGFREKIFLRNPKDVLPAIFKNTQRSHTMVDEAKDDRSETMLTSYMGLKNVDGSSDEIDDFLEKVTNVPYPYTAIQDPGGVQSVAESDPGVIAVMRYLLEPQGIKVGSWSMVNGKTPGEATFSFSDQLYDMMKEQTLFRDVFKSVPGSGYTEKCSNLKELSKKAMEGSASFADEGSNQYLNSICTNRSSEAEVESIVKEDIGKKTCLVCHSSIATHVADIFSNKNHAKEILLGPHLNDGPFYKTTLRLLNEGRMPPGGFGIGDTEEKRIKNDKDRREVMAMYIENLIGERRSICQQNTKRYDPGRSRPFKEGVGIK